MKISIEGVNKDEDLLSTLCILPISVGQDYHKKDLLNKTLDQLFKTGFRHFLVVVADTLQRHTLALSEEAANSEDMLLNAKMAGDQWLEDTKEIFDDFTTTNDDLKSLRIVRWEIWQTQSIFESQVSQIRERYSRDSVFRSVVDRVVTRFVHGFLAAHPDIPFDRERAGKLSEEYILEEAAVISMWADTDRVQPEFSEYQTLCMAYPFGNHPTNNAIYNYLKEVIDESNFRLINIHIKAKNVQKPRYKPDIKSTIQGEGVSLSEEDEKQLTIVQATVFGGLHAVLASNALSLPARLALAEKLLREAHKIQLESVSLLALTSEQHSDNKVNYLLGGQESSLFNLEPNSVENQKKDLPDESVHSATLGGLG